MAALIYDQAISAYIERVRAIPRLSREVEHELAIRAAGGDQDAVRQLIEANLRYVVSVALQYRRYGIPLSELIAEGSVGLMLAVGKFTPERGTRFVTYAGYWIRAYVLDLVVRSARMVGAGSGALRSKVFFRLRRERARLAATEPDAAKRVDILAGRFHVSTSKMQSMLRQIDGRDVSLDAKLGDDTSMTGLDVLRDESRDQERDLLAAERAQHLRGELDAALGLLDRRERYIVDHRMMADEELSLAELGRRLGVSRERARQLEARAKRKLRDRLERFAA